MKPFILVTLIAALGVAAWGGSIYTNHNTAVLASRHDQELHHLTSRICKAVRVSVQIQQQSYIQRVMFGPVTGDFRGYIDHLEQDIQDLDLILDGYLKAENCEGPP